MIAANSHRVISTNMNSGATRLDAYQRRSPSYRDWGPFFLASKIVYLGNFGHIASIMRSVAST